MGRPLDSWDLHLENEPAAGLLLRRVGLACTAASTAFGLFAILGWETPARRLASIEADFIPMAPSTALAFVLLGAAALAHAGRPSSGAVTRWVAASACAVSGLAVIQIVQYLGGWTSTIDALLVPHPTHLALVPTGRMSPLTAGALLLGGTSVLAVLAGRRRPALNDVAGFLNALMMVLSLVVILGYSYGTPLLYGGTDIPMALTSALAFAALAVGLMALAGRGQFPLRQLSGASARARLLRAFLPIAPAVIIADGLFVRMVPVPNPALHAALLALLLALVVVGGVARAASVVARALDQTEEERRARDRAEAEVRELDGRYRMLFENNPHPMWVCDLETLRFVAVNAEAVRHYGHSREEFLALTVNDICPAPDVPARAEGASEDRPGPWALGARRHRKKDGSVIQVEVASHEVPFGGRRALAVMATDVTERRRLEEQLGQSQKMEAVGQLAGGIAHDFNNLLGVIAGYADLLLREFGRGDRRFRRVEQIQKAVARAADLTRQLLAFGRLQVLAPSVLDLGTVVADVEGMLRRLIGEDIEIVTVCEPGLGRVKVDRGQMEQVILNLAVNSRDAMPRGGKLILETANVHLDENYARDRVDVRPGDYVMLAVSDTGHGMDAATQARIFEPFFTTKGQGKGTGLGLATAYGIVKQSAGHIAVYSEEGRGTTFKIYLPRTDEEAIGPAAVPPSEPLRGGSETILVAEDEQALRAIIREVLEESGYSVLESSSPEQALELARSHPGPIHLMLTDVVMPRRSGREIASDALVIRPQMKTLYMSGYTNEAIGHHGILATGDHFLQKPFTTESLLSKVREALSSGQ